MTFYRVQITNDPLSFSKRITIGSAELPNAPVETVVTEIRTGAKQRATIVSREITDDEDEYGDISYFLLPAQLCDALRDALNNYAEAPYDVKHLTDKNTIQGKVIATAQSAKYARDVVRRNNGGYVTQPEHSYRPTR